MRTRRRSETLSGGFASLGVARALAILCALVYALIPSFTLCACTGMCLANGDCLCDDMTLSEHGESFCQDASVESAKHGCCCEESATEEGCSCCGANIAHKEKNCDSKETCRVDFSKSSALISTPSETSAEQFMGELRHALSVPGFDLLIPVESAFSPQSPADVPVPTLRLHLLLTVLRN